MGYADNIKRAPSSGGSGSSTYMKFEQGENKFRIVGTVEDGGFITGMVGWVGEKKGDRKPFRWKVDEKAPDERFSDKPKEFFAILVFNYAVNRVQVVEITQRGLKDELISYIEDEEWGDPRKYDIAVIKSGEGRDTRYAMVPKPHKKMTDEQREIIKNTKADLTALYRGEHPMEESSETLEEDSMEEPF